MSEILPDVLASGLRIVFCGTAAGAESARRGAYYAHPGNKFWRTVYDVGLTPHLVAPAAYLTVLQYGIGLTDLAKFTFGNDSDLAPDDFDAAAVRAKIMRYQPHVLAFTSKTAGTIFAGRRTIPFGRQPETVGATIVHVLPSPSGLAQRSWDLSLWQAAAADALTGPRA